MEFLAGLAKGRDGNLYGTTAFGGYGAGNIFRIIMPGSECRLTCPTNITVCNSPGQCGAFVEFARPVSTNCNGYIITCEPQEAEPGQNCLSLANLQIPPKFVQ